MYGNMFDNLFLMFAIACIVIGVAIGALVFWLIPIFWNWIVPIIHAATA